METQKETPSWRDFLNRVVPGSPVDKIIGMIYGHALGDAVGLITEFKFKRDAHKVIFPYTESVRGFPVCDWTDDTDHLILVMQSMIASNFTLDKQDMTHRLKTWVSTGFKELGDDVGKGLGGTMNMVINHPKFLENPNEASAEIWYNSGKRLAANGSLMRTSIVGALPDPFVVEAWAAELSKITHADPRCTSSCVLQSTIIHDLIYRGVESPGDVDALLQHCVKIARKFVQNDEEPVIFGDIHHQPTPAACHDATFKSRDEELSHWVQLSYTKRVGELRLDDMVKIGYVFKCLGCSIYALQVIKIAIKNNKVPSFRKFITKIAEECGDADTNCAVAGAVMGAYLGYKNLPQEWIEPLPNQDWLNDIIVQYISLLHTVYSSQGSARNPLTDPRYESQSECLARCLVENNDQSDQQSDQQNDQRNDQQNNEHFVENPASCQDPESQG